MKSTLAVFVLALAVALPAAAQGSGGLPIVQLPISLPGALTAQLTVGFEDASNVSPSTLGVSVLPLPLGGLGLLGRLPLATSLLGSLPILIRIEPPTAGSLSFHGVATIDLQLPEILGLVDLPARLYAAPLGGSFADITRLAGADEETRSYRVVGSKGAFSEFLLVLDLRPLNTVASGKLTKLSQVLTANSAAIAPSVYGLLTAQLATVQSDYASGDFASALSDLAVFQATVAAHSGSDIPDLWRSARDVTNVAGLLRAGGDTLGFSLRQLEDAAP